MSGEEYSRQRQEYIHRYSQVFTGWEVCGMSERTTHHQCAWVTVYYEGRYTEVKIEMSTKSYCE